MKGTVEIVFIVGLLAAPATALDAEKQGKMEGVVAAGRGAREAVRIGNERLRAGRPDEALEAYRQAGNLEPDAREIDFVEGLAHFDMGNYDLARDAFRRAAGVAYDDLSADSFYSMAAADHAEALASMESAPQGALSQLENAMRRYHEVLNQRPDHAAARDANRRAATVWRKLKQQLQEQREQNDNQDRNQGEQNEDQQEQERDQQQEGDQQDKQQGDRQQDDQQEQQASDSDEDSERQPSDGQRQEEVSREQAERRLRELMQAVRDRKKQRRGQTGKMQIAPVEKDW